MIRIAICDDDEIVCTQLERMISKFNMKYEFDLRCSSYNSCEALYHQIEMKEKFHLIFLDIEFPDMKGTEFGDLLRRCKKDFDTSIIFISSKQDYCMDLFKIRPIEFLVKPLERSQVEMCLLNFITYYENSYDFLEYTNENIKHRIRIDEIIYIQSDRKKLIFYTSTKEITAYGKISDLVESKREHFVLIKRGIAVNLHHVVESTSTNVQMSNGKILKISRGYQDAVRDRLAGLCFLKI